MGKHPLEKQTYQVWHDRGWPQSRINQTLGGWPPSQFPDDYFHAANVQADGLREVVEKTTHIGHLLRSDPPFQPWDTKDGVESFTPKPFSPRETDAGDVIVSPSGQPYRYEGNTFKEIKAEERTDSYDQMLNEAGRHVKGARMAKRKYESPPEHIEEARELMGNVKAALTKDASGNFPPKYAEVDWGWMNMQDPTWSWQEMDANQRFNMLCDCMEEGIWLNPRDSQKLSAEFIRAEERENSYNQMLAEANSRSTRSDKDKGPSR